MGTVVGIDVGGTFTDLWAVDEERGLVITKVPSTPASPSAAVIDALAAAKIDAGGIAGFSHGITVATNILVQRNGATVGLLTTRGFRDIVELGRRDRPQPYGMWGRADPLVPRDRRLEIDERIGSGGEVLIPLDDDEVTAAGMRLAEAGVECIVVAFLHSYTNDAHESRAAEVLAATLPEVMIIRSSEVIRDFHEFERISTACVQAYVAPTVDRYARTLDEALREGGYGHEIAIMQSNGGVVGLSKVRNRAANLIRSGPAAGVVGAIRLAAAAGVENLITADMGGTSFDVSVVNDLQPRVTDETLLDFRIPLRLPTIDVASIGAGGGSIARVDDGGLLRVGPTSAGADPGPAAWGRGGSEPTVTDANLVLGRIGAESRIGEGRTLDIEAARAAITRLGEAVGLGCEEASAGVIEIADNNMAQLIRMMTVQRGLDPRSFSYVPFGGAGPLHAVGISRVLGVDHILVPPFPGVLSAMGSLLAEIRHDTVQTLDLTLDPSATDPIRSTCKRLAEWGAAEMRSEDIGMDSMRREFVADICYVGQMHTMQVPFDPETEHLAASLATDFEELYESEFIARLDREVMVVNVRASFSGVRPPVDWSVPWDTEGESPSPVGERDVHFACGWVTAAIYHREDLGRGALIEGPCVVEGADSTFVMDPGSRGTVDPAGNLTVNLG